MRRGIEFRQGQFRPIVHWRIVLLACLAWGCESGTEFRIHGDLGEVVRDGEVVLTQYTSLVSESEEFAAVPIEDGRFELRADTWAPRFVTLKFQVDGRTEQTIELIVEPGEEVLVSHGDWVSGLSAEGGPYHQRLIASWQTAPEYLEALANYRDVMTRKRALEDAGIYATGATDGESSLLDRAWAGWEALKAIEDEALDAWVRQREDPLASYLALELGGREETTTVLAKLDELEPLLPDEVVRRQLLPMRLRSEVMDRIADNVDGFALGERVTDFTVPDLAGNPVRLYDLLAENKLVLIDFWAAWCAPCLAQFPQLKALREQYGDRGFEILGFSVDAEERVWRNTSEEYELPWPDVSDQQALSSPITIRYGATILPFNYLIDADGRVLGKRVMPDELEAELAARL